MSLDNLDKHLTEDPNDDYVGYCSVHEADYSAWVGCIHCLSDAMDRRYDAQKEQQP